MQLTQLRRMQGWPAKTANWQYLPGYILPHDARDRSAQRHLLWPAGLRAQMTGIAVTSIERMSCYAEDLAGRDRLATLSHAALRLSALAG